MLLQTLLRGFRVSWLMVNATTNASKSHRHGVLKSGGSRSSGGTLMLISSATAFPI